MKKPIRILLSAILALSLLAAAMLPAFAGDATPAALTYTYDEASDTLTVTGTGAIPDRIGESFVMDDIPALRQLLEDDPHKDVRNAKTLVIGEGITSVGAGAFLYYGAETVVLPSTLTSIGDAAFALCTDLKTVQFPAALRHIGEGAFAGCVSLLCVTLNEGLETLGDDAFGYYITEISIPSTLVNPHAGEPGGEAWYSLEKYFRTEALTVIRNASSAFYAPAVYNNGSLESVRRGIAYYAYIQRAMLRYYLSGDMSLDAGLAAYAAELDWLNRTLGTSFTLTSAQELEQLMAELEAYCFVEGTGEAFSYLTVECPAGSNQQLVCEHRGYPYTAVGEADPDAFSLNDFTVSGQTALGLCWEVDAASFTLSIWGNGSLTFPDGAPWSAYKGLFDRVDFRDDCRIACISSCEGFLNMDIRTLRLGAGIEQITPSAISGFGVSVEAYVVSPENEYFTVGNGALYRTAGGRKYLASVPAAAKEFTFAEGTVGVGDYAFYGCGLTSLVLPDSIEFLAYCAVYNCAALTSLHLGKGLRSMDDRAIQDNRSLTQLTVDAENPYYKTENGMLFSKDGRTLYYAADGIADITVPAFVEKIADHAVSGGARKTVRVLNPDCEMDDPFPVSNVTLYGYAGSAAQAWAENRGAVDFRFLDDQEIADFTVTVPPCITEYYAGEPVDLFGAVFTVTYQDGSSAEITSGVASPGRAAAGQTEATVEYCGKTASFPITVSEAAGQRSYEITAGETAYVLMDTARTSVLEIPFVPDQTGWYDYKIDSEYGGYSITYRNESTGWTCSDFFFDEYHYFEAGVTYTFIIRVYGAVGVPCCGFSLLLYPPHDHTNLEFVTDLEPTCSAAGKGHYRCVDCGAQIRYYGGIGMLPHTPDENGICTSCGKKTLYNVSYGETVRFAESGASCSNIVLRYTAEETRTVTLSEVGSASVANVRYNGTGVSVSRSFSTEPWGDVFTFEAEQGETYEILVGFYSGDGDAAILLGHAHTWTSEIAREATCTETGLRRYTCTQCGESCYEAIGKADHTPDGGYASVKYTANCGKGYDGNLRVRCAECGGFYDERIWWQHEETNNDGLCDVCGSSLGELIMLGDVVEAEITQHDVFHCVFTPQADGDYTFTVYIRSTGSDDYVNLSINDLYRYFYGYYGFAITDEPVYFPEKDLWGLTLTVSLEAGHTVIVVPWPQASSQPASLVLELTHTHRLAPVEETPATCTEDGNIAYWVCGTCGEYFADENGETVIEDKNSVILTALDHAWGEWTPADDQNHIRVCGHNASHTEIAAHSWNNGVVTTPPTCAEAGVITYTCAVCGGTKNEDVGTAEHIDANGDGFCDYGCGYAFGGQSGEPDQPSDPEPEKETFIDRIVNFFRRIAEFFKRLFTR